MSGLNYAHPDLTTQLEELKLRCFELDIHWQPSPKFDPEVFHIRWFDEKTNCSPLSSCLSEMLSWSQANPNHLPITTLIESKKFWQDEDFALNFNTLLVQTIGRSNIFSPRNLQGSYKSIEERLNKQGWPDVNSLRGKFIFILNNPRKWDHGYHQTTGSNLAFSWTTDEGPWTGFIKIEDPDILEIQKAIKKQLIVYSRTDKHLIHDENRRLNAINSGVQLLYSDFIEPTLPHYWQLKFGGYSCIPEQACEVDHAR